MGKISIISHKKIFIIAIFFFYISFNYLYSNYSVNDSNDVESILKSASDIGIKNRKQSLTLIFKAYQLSKKSKNKQNQIKSLKMLINIYKELEDNQKSIKYLLKLYELEKELKKVSTYTLIDLGDVYSLKNSLSLALNYYKKALEITENKTDSKDKAELLIKIGTVFGQLGNYKNELKYYLKANKLLINTKNNKSLATLLNNLGTVYDSLDDVEKTIDFYKKAYSLSKKIKDKMGETIALGNIANFYLNKKQYKKAIETFNKSLKISKSIDDKKGISFSLSGISGCYIEMKRFDQAEKYSIEALKVSLENGEMSEIAENYLTLSDIYLEKGKIKISLSYLKKAENIAVKSKALPILADVYDLYVSIFKKNKNYLKALEYLEKYIKIDDKIYSKDRINKSIEMQTMYETLEKDKEIKLLNKDKYLNKLEINRQQLIKRGVLFGTFVIIIIVFLILNRYRIKKKSHAALTIAHRSLETANRIISEKNQHITDSINYAQNIQLAILPLKTKISKSIKEYFIFFKPKDIVSGDFYWFNELDGIAYIAVVDCTGHGVPGAFMSMIGYSLLNQILIEKKIKDPAEILTTLSIGVRKILKQDKVDAKANDGMDVCLCSIDIHSRKLIFSGARRPLYYIKNQTIKTENPKIIEIKGTRRSVGGERKIEKRKFINHNIPIESGDLFYLTSDGFADQSSPEGIKFSSSKLRNLLSDISILSLKDQKVKISNILNSHRKTEEQRDDITIFGFKITI